jgi:hypothetical protein
VNERERESKICAETGVEEGEEIFMPKATVGYFVLLESIQQ